MKIIVHVRDRAKFSGHVLRELPHKFGKIIATIVNSDVLISLLRKDPVRYKRNAIHVIAGIQQFLESGVTSLGIEFLTNPLLDLVFVTAHERALKDVVHLPLCLVRSCVSGCFFVDEIQHPFTCIFHIFCKKRQLRQYNFIPIFNFIPQRFIG